LIAGTLSVSFGAAAAVSVAVEEPGVAALAAAASSVAAPVAVVVALGAASNSRRHDHHTNHCPRREATAFSAVRGSHSRCSRRDDCLTWVATWSAA